MNQLRLCTRSLYFVLLALLAVALPRAEAQDLFWTVNGATIMGADRDGTNVVEFFDGTGMAGTAVDVVVTETHVYWTDKNDTEAGGVWRANRDGTGAALFVTNPNNSNWAPQFIAIDKANDALYFSCYFTGLYSATLSTGGAAVSLGRPDGQPINPDNYPTTTGLALRGSNELISVSGANDGILYSTNISNKSHEEIGWLSSGGGNHGLDYDSATDTIYYAGAGGTLYSYNITGYSETTLVSGLALPLGVRLSESKSHVLYVERNGDKISAYNLAEPNASFELVSGQGAWFGVAIAGDPLAPSPVPPLELPLVETFENGAPGESIVGQLTSDGQGIWQLLGNLDGTVEYGGEPGAVTFEPFTNAGLAAVSLAADLEEIENYDINFDDILLRGGFPTLGSSLFIGTRKSVADQRGGYEFRQWSTNDGTNYTFRWAIWFRHTDGTETTTINWTSGTAPMAEVDAGDYSASELLRSGLQIQVRGNQQRLYLDGSPIGNPFPTQGSYNDGTDDLALVIGTIVSGDANTIMNPAFNGFSIELPPEPGVPPFKRLYVYDGFDYAAGDLVGQNGGSGWAEAWAPSTELNPEPASALVLSPGETYGDLETVGNKAQTADARRAFRAMDVAGLYTGAEEQPPSDAVGWPDSSVWMSFITEGAAAASDPFWGISLFRGDKEKLFFGKPTNGTALRLSAQGGAQDFDHAISINDKHFIVVRIDFDPEAGDSATLFLNPDPMGRTPPDDEALGVYTGPAFDMAFNRVRLANGGGAGGTIDELRIGATWADVTPVPYNGFVNGDFEEEPFLRGWSNVQNITSHAGIAPGSTTAVYVTNDKSAPEFYPLLSQHRPNTLEVDTVPYLDPVTGEPLAPTLRPTGPEWQVGFYTTVADPGASGYRSLNVGIGHERPEGYTGKLQPAINFRIIGGGGAQAFLTGSGWQDVFPAGTFDPSTVTDGEFLDPTVYYIQFDGDYTTTPATYTVSARRVGEDNFFAVSDPMSAFQYVSPDAGSGIVTVRFNGYVEAPYVVDDVHMISVGEPLPEGYADWAESKFGAGADESIAGPTADPDGDRIENLLEYAFGLEPLTASRDGLPTQAVEDIGGELYLTLTFTRPTGTTDLDYVVRESNDLGTWTESAVPVGDPSDNGDGTETVNYRASEPINTSSRTFLEVRVDRITMS